MCKGLGVYFNLGEIQVQNDIHLDVRGKSCPIPLLRLRHSMKSLQTGDICNVWTTDAGAVGDIRTFCADNGHTFQSIHEKPCADYDVVYECVIQK